ncbi:ABC transporter ATP-binding protein [Propioniciclava soli]|uniref:ABC transporter ATP-binding protein n=1 Tax=Propioniciclava soli TaxID=2775081 RepID=A0ABZ3C5G9_9ACTN|nr:ABC transporter ATP-binding protein [Propioniciclava soli]
MAGVTLAEVGLTYPDGHTALTGVDLEVADGEFVALVGPSGSGKTTLLRTVAGFLAPSRGTVAIGGEPVASPGAGVPPEGRRLGMVFQQHAIWPHMSVGANVAYPLRRARRPRAEIGERVTEVLALVGLDGYADRNPATLSGGQRQRVALARALAPTPRVLLLDEALSALDEPLRDQLRVELRSLTRQLGLTVIHVTHDRDEALALADRIAVLDAGAIVQVDTPERLLHEPATPFVAGFLSDATLLPGELTDSGFVADEHPLRLARDVVVGPGRGSGTLAVLPGDVVLHEGAPGGEEGRAEVVSSLYGRTASDVIVDWHGLRLRAESDGRPVVGARVRPEVRRALFYPDVAGTAG